MQYFENDVKIGQKLAPFNPTHEDAIKMAIEILSITSSDIVYDLGCGDGRFIIQSYEKKGIKKGVGIEYDRALVEKAQINCKCREDEVNYGKLNIVHSNVLDTDFSEATVLFIYLVPEGIKMLKLKLLDMLNKGCRIATYIFSIPGVKPKRVELFKGITKLYLYQLDDATSIDFEDSIIVKDALNKVINDSNLMKCILFYLPCYDLVNICIAGNFNMRSIMREDLDVDDLFRIRISQDLNVHAYKKKDTNKRPPGYFRRLYLNIREEIIEQENLICGGH